MARQVVGYQTRHHKHIGLHTPNSLKYLNASPKVKTMKEERIGRRSLTRNTSGVRGVCWSSGMGTKMSDKWVNYSYQFAQIKQQVGYYIV